MPVKLGFFICLLGISRIDRIPNAGVRDLDGAEEEVEKRIDKCFPFPAVSI